VQIEVCKGRSKAATTGLDRERRCGYSSPISTCRSSLRVRCPAHSAFKGGDHADRIRCFTAGAPTADGADLAVIGHAGARLPVRI